MIYCNSAVIENLQQFMLIPPGDFRTEQVKSLLNISD